MGSHQSVRGDKAYCPANEFAGHSENCSLCIKNGRFRVCYFVGHMFCRWRNWGIVSTWKLVSGAQQTCLDSAQLGFSVGMDNHLFFRFLRGRSRGRYGGQRCCSSLLGYAGRVLDPLDTGVFWAAAIAWRAFSDVATMAISIRSDPSYV